MTTMPTQSRRRTASRPSRCRSRRRRLAFRCASRPTGGACSMRTGRPVLLQGDAAWSLIANSTSTRRVHYLDDRRAKGFNTLIVNLIEYLLLADPPRDLAGDEPFTTPGDIAHAERRLLRRRGARARRLRRARHRSCCLRPATSATATTAATAFRAASTAGTTRSSPPAQKAAAPTASISAAASAASLTSSGCIGGDWHPEEASRRSRSRSPTASARRA